MIEASLTAWGLSPKGYVVLSVCRPGNVDDRSALTGLLVALVEISRQGSIIELSQPGPKKWRKS